MEHLPNEYRSWLESARSRRKSIRAFLDRLKKNPPRDLDQVTHAFHDLAFSQIDCLKCAQCCATTGPLFKTKDIERLSRHLNIRPADFVSRHLRQDEDNDYVFNRLPCPFLREDRCCSVYESRPGACRDYPHTQERETRKKLDLMYHNAMICPAVAVVVSHLQRTYDS